MFSLRLADRNGAQAGARSRRRARTRAGAFVFTLLLTAATAPAQSISGTVFEDFNYGGGAGRDRASAAGSDRPAARVELYSAGGALVSSTATDLAGAYAFAGLTPGSSYSVRVVNASVSSSRAGYLPALLPVQTFRTDAASGVALPVTDHVGGEIPALVDAGDGATTLAALTTATTTAQSVTPGTLGPPGAVDIIGVDFGFSFNVVVSVRDTGQGSLRQFLTNANALANPGLAQAGRTAGIDNAVFEIPGAGPHTIALATWLPSITSPIVLDGTTQPGFSGTPIIELDGSATTYDGLQAGLKVLAGNSTVRGLVINRFAVDGIRLESGSNNVIEGNYIGTDVSGVLDRGNAYDGVFILSAGNRIGGPLPGQGNVISGNNDQGIDLRVGSANRIEGNLIGIAADGTTALGNFRQGVLITGGTGNTVTANRIATNGGIGIDLLGDGVTANDGATTAGQPNLLMDFPILTSALLAGTSLSVSGYVGSAPGQATFASASVELFLADADPTGFGEGRTLLGTLTADASGNFAGTLTVAGLTTGDRLTATATDAAGNTSEFGPNATIVGPFAISGSVFEDFNYGGGAGRARGIAAGSNRPAARVELYDAAGGFISFTATDLAGAYAFPGLAPGSYSVRVVSASVSSSRAGYFAGLLPVQTFRTDAASGVALSVTDHVGGEIPALVDAGDGATNLAALTTATTTAQSLTLVTVGAVDVAGVDFGFSFNVVVNVNDSGQGSLRQFVLNSNALGNAGLAIQGQTLGRDVSVFIISDGLAHAGLRAGIASLLSVAGVAVIAPVSALPAITAADTSVDGTTQTANVGNTNAVVLGTVGTVGVDGLALNTVAGPEVEIRDSGTLACGLHIQAANAVVRGLAIHGFGTATGQAGVCVDAFPGALIENNVLGSSATLFADPGPAQRNQAGVYSGGGINGTVQNNLIGFGRVTGVYLNTGTAGWTITGNQIRDSGMDTADGDGITINAGTTNTSIGNLITGSSSQGFVVTVAPANGNVFTNNTVTGNGVGTPSGLVQSTGITLRAGATSTVLDRNVIRANYGAGVQANNGSTGTRMTRNSFADNGTITARNGGVATGQIGIDLNSPTDNINFGGNLGLPPFPTLNDLGDADTGGNGLLNFPVLVSAALFGGNLSLRGHALAGSVIELFIASPDPTGFGEGTTYSITLTEGGTGAGVNDPYADTDPGTSTYGPGPVNGIAQGTDTTNRFAFTLPVPGGIGVGTQLTATATLGGETSEFSGNVTVANATAVWLMSFEAAPSDGAVELSWRTGSELNNLGFHLYRGLSADGPWTRLNSSLIPGQGFSATGAAYVWRDSGLQNGTRYYYRLEDVDSKSGSTFHGPVSAIPQAGGAPPVDGGGSASGGSSSSGSGNGSEPSPSAFSCPPWARAQLGSSSSSYTCETHGDPFASSFRVLSQSARSAVVELLVPGFVTARDASGRVRVLIPGFDSLEGPRDPALPLKRALLEGVVGKRARIQSVEALDLRSFPGLVPAAVGFPQALVSADGTVQPGRRAATVRLVGQGYLPREQARLSGEGFLGEEKTLTVELVPVRFDVLRGQLLLVRRLVVRIEFAGGDSLEKGRGRFGRRARKPRTDTPAYAFLGTSAKGLHAVTFESLFPGRRRPLDVATLRLTREPGPGSAAGTSRVLVPFHVEPRTGSFGPGSRLFFHSDVLAPSMAFSPEIVYALERGTGGVRMGIARASVDGSAVASSQGFGTWETNRLFAPDVLDIGDLWQWESMLGGASQAKAFALDGLDQASPETARVVVYLQGGSDAESVVDHHVRVSVNGVVVGEESFDGAVPYRVESEAPVSLLRPDTNELVVLNVGDTGVSSRVFLDRFEVLYPQVGAGRAGAFDGVFSKTGTAQVAGLVSPAAVVDVTSGTWLVGYESGGSVRFRAEAHRYLAVSEEALLSPRVFFPETTARLRSPLIQADYVLIAPQAFLGAAQPLLDRRASQGLTTFAASLEEIASSFGGGQPSAEAIRDFLSFAWHGWKQPSPRYVVLLGDANHDPRHFVASSQPSPMPFLLHKTSYIWTVSDPALAAVNGDDLVPDLAIGRLPATTLEQAHAMVGKILDWEEQGNTLEGRVALVADNPDLAGNFEANVRDIESSFLAGRDTTSILLGQVGNRDVARAQILDAFNQGLSLISYVGHGGGAVWAGENILNSWDAASLQAQPRQPLMLTMNCLNGYFITPYYESLAEAFLKAEGRGTIAAFSPSGLSLDGPAHLFHRAVMQEVTSGQHARLGDALLAAQRTYAATGAMPELLSVYHLFGDPAMRMR